jgi:tRNA(adenine34) deaminase
MSEDVDAGSSIDEERMQEAIAEASLAALAGEVPVGAVAVYEGRIIARAHNLRETSQDPTAHAELLVLREVAQKLGTWRLIGVTIYVTLEPCPMCAGALVNARVDRVVWGCDDPKAGATRTLYTIGADPRLNHRFAMEAGVSRDACAEPLKTFFGAIRAARRASKAPVTAELASSDASRDHEE